MLLPLSMTNIEDATAKPNASRSDRFIAMVVGGLLITAATGDLLCPSPYDLDAIAATNLARAKIEASPDMVGRATFQSVHMVGSEGKRVYHVHFWAAYRDRRGAIHHGMILATTNLVDGSVGMDQQ